VSPSASSVPFGATIIRLADVEPERVRWLWPGYLPLGKLVVLDGDPDQGKSAITLDWAAKVSTGSPMPDGGEPVKGAALILSAEDGLADTIRPRLDAAGGDPAQIITITEMSAVTEDGQPITRPVAIPRDLPAIENVITRNGVVLVIVDVLMAYLDGSVDSYRDQDVRRALYPLAMMADRTGCCIVTIRHFTKSGTRAIHRGGGSVGIGGAARAGFMVATDPDDDGDTHVLAPVKLNLAKHPPALAYRLDEDEARGCVRVTWLGESGQTADALLADSDSEERTDQDEAVEWLTGYLIDRGSEAGARDIIKDGARDGFHERTLQRARRKAKDPRITTGKAGMRGGWVWRLDYTESDQPGRPKAPEDDSKTPKATKMTGIRDVSSSSPSVVFRDPDSEPGRASGHSLYPDDGPEPRSEETNHTMTDTAYDRTTSAAAELILTAHATGHDIAEWLAVALAQAAARLGSTEALLANRPGSWEAASLRQLLAGTAGEADEYLTDYTPGRR
jgi:hypothetical protein